MTIDDCDELLKSEITNHQSPITNESTIKDHQISNVLQSLML